MSADVYQKLHEFNRHIDDGIAALRRMAEIKDVAANEIRRYAEYLEEIRSSSSGYVGALVADQEQRDCGRLFAKRRRHEMAEDPMHGGWLEKEREKKRLQKLRRQKGSRKRIGGKEKG